MFWGLHDSVTSCHCSLNYYMWNYLVNKALQVKRNLSSMGAEQSGSGAQLKSQRDDDIPYTSFSISKPIDGGGYSLSLVTS